MECKISVIMGIYNCATTLPEALDSLLNQTYTQWKCIMCNDGSSDNTYDVAKEYVEKYPEKFILLNNNINLKLNKTLNKCLDLVDTEFVARMDADDISLPTRFEKEIEYLINHNEFDLVSTPMILFDNIGDFRTTTRISNPTKKQVCTGSYICHAPVMIRTDAFKKVKGYSTDVKTMRVEDVDLWIRLYEQGSRCYNLDEPLYKMRDDRNAVSRRKYKYRINSTRVRLKGCKAMDLGITYKVKCLAPMIIGILPKPIYTLLHKIK